MKSSFILILTINPAIINKNKPVDASNIINGLKYKPNNKPVEPINWSNPVNFL